MNILAISGSLRNNSYNTALLKALADSAPPQLRIEVFNRIGSIPPFDAELSEDLIPDSVSALRKRIESSDAVIISTPEYAHGVPGALKNALDWLVNAGELVLKPVAVMSVSTSGLGGIRSSGPLTLILSAMNWNVVVEASVNIPYASNRFNHDLELTDGITLQRLKCSLAALERAIEESR